jgi:hypothetical protein
MTTPYTASKGSKGPSAGSRAKKPDGKERRQFLVGYRRQS